MAGYVIADIAALKAISPRSEAMLRYPQSKKRWYSWDSTLSGVGNDDTLVEASDAPPVGRWAVSHALPSSRANVSAATVVIANNAIAQQDLSFATYFSILSVTTSVAARVRLYSTAAARTADVSRNELTQPPLDSGLILDLATESDDLSVVVSPIPGGNMDTPVSDIIYAAITNKSGGIASVSLSFVIERMATAGISLTPKRSLVEKIFLLNNL